GRQLRFALLERLARDSDRHLIMLTATPHSGDDAAFGNLLSLIKPDFASLAGTLSDTANNLRSELAAHFIQRRRRDIDEWQDASVFPTRRVRDATYKLSGEWGRFFEETREYCLGLAQKAEQEQGESARMMWYATLALLRCISSSPAAAASALSTRLQGSREEMARLAEEDRVDDGLGEELETNDQEPAARLEESGLIESLLEKARNLHGPSRDPKLERLIREVDGLVKEGFRPVIFCRYIATATYLADELRKHFNTHQVDCVTGLLTSEERAGKVAFLSQEKYPILVATDCLSEGVNLQDGFTAVIHYDLAWNPTRHEQREGRVDRFGQKAREVRCVMLYGEDNPVDGFIFNVIIRKAESIKSELGVLVPMPDDDRRMRLAVVKAALMKKRPDDFAQGSFDFGEDHTTRDLVDTINAEWTDSMEKAKANRTVFAQRRLKPAEVLPEWHKQMAALGKAEDVERFTLEALTRLSARPDAGNAQHWHFSPASLPLAVRERLAQEGVDTAHTISFHYPCDAGARFIHRSHTLVSILADQLLESALSGESALAARSGCFETSTVQEVTTLYLLRIRHQIRTETRKSSCHLMAEESIAFALGGRSNPRFLPLADVESLLDRHPEGNLDRAVISREVQKSIDWYHDNTDLFAGEAQKRSDALRDDHTRVRAASSMTSGKTLVQPCLPVDLIGVYVLLPAGDL
ncbi:MAG: DEAD/DEAH box helicase, partial [Spirochaetales bacterium]|nr:DEAD/DEAH box helicase [Spirochaetales bacterium]